MNFFNVDNDNLGFDLDLNQVEAADLRHKGSANHARLSEGTERLGTVLDNLEEDLMDSGYTRSTGTRGHWSSHQLNHRTLTEDEVEVLEAAIHNGNRAYDLQQSGDTDPILEELINDGMDARETVAVHYQRYVSSVVRKYRHSYVDNIDLRQAGNLGLVKAFNQLDLDHEKSFRRSLTGLIASYVASEIMSVYDRFSNNMISMGVHERRLSHRIPAIRLDLETQLGRQATVSELLDYVKANHWTHPTQKLDAKMLISLETAHIEISLDNVKDDESRHWSDTVSAPDPIYDAEQEADYQDIISWLTSDLSEIEREVFIRRALRDERFTDLDEDLGNGVNSQYIYKKKSLPKIKDFCERHGVTADNLFDGGPRHETREIDNPVTETFSEKLERQKDSAKVDALFTLLRDAVMSGNDDRIDKVVEMLKPYEEYLTTLPNLPELG